MEKTVLGAAEVERRRDSSSIAARRRRRRRCWKPRRRTRVDRIANRKPPWSCRSSATPCDGRSRRVSTPSSSAASPIPGSTRCARWSTSRWSGRATARCTWRRSSARAIAFISPLDGRGGPVRGALRALGLSATARRRVRGIGMSVLDAGPASARRRWIAWPQVGRRGDDEDGADVLVLGCMSMAFLGVTASAAPRLPVVNPVIGGAEDRRDGRVDGSLPQQGGLSRRRRRCS